MSTSVEKVAELIGELPEMLREMIGPAGQLVMPFLEPRLRDAVPADPAVLDGHLQQLADYVLGLRSDPIDAETTAIEEAADAPA